MGVGHTSTAGVTSCNARASCGTAAHASIAT
jgi:hypothetical protein